MPREKETTVAESFRTSYVARLEKRQAIERVRQSIAARSVSERLMRKSLSLCAAASKKQWSPRKEGAGSASLSTRPVGFAPTVEESQIDVAAARISEELHDYDKKLRMLRRNLHAYAPGSSMQSLRGSHHERIATAPTPPPPRISLSQENKAQEDTLIVGKVVNASGQGCQDVIAAGSDGKKAIWKTHRHKSSRTESSCMLQLKSHKYRDVTVRIAFAESDAVPSLVCFDHAPKPTAAFTSLGQVPLQAKSMKQLKHVFRLGSDVKVDRCLRITCLGNVSEKNGGIHAISRLTVTGIPLPRLPSKNKKREPGPDAFESPGSAASSADTVCHTISNTSVASINDIHNDQEGAGANGKLRGSVASRPEATSEEEDHMLATVANAASSVDQQSTDASSYQDDLDHGPSLSVSIRAEQNTIPMTSSLGGRTADLFWTNGGGHTERDLLDKEPTPHVHGLDSPDGQNQAHRFEEETGASVRIHRLLQSQEEEDPSIPHRLEVLSAERASYVQDVLERLDLTPEMATTSLLQALGDVAGEPELADEDIDRLMRCVPTDEESREIATLSKRELLSLGPAERLILHLGDVPSIQERSKAFLFLRTFDERVKNVSNTANVVTKACKEARGSRCLRHAVDIAKTLSGFVSRASDDSMRDKAFRLHDLAKLKDVAWNDQDRSNSLLHFLARELHRKLPDERSFSLTAEIPSLLPASKLSIHELREEVNELADGIEFAHRVGKETGADAMEMDEMLDLATEQLAEANVNVMEADAALLDLHGFFSAPDNGDDRKVMHDTSVDDDGSSVFASLAEFSTQLDEAHRDVVVGATSKTTTNERQDGTVAGDWRMGYRSDDNVGSGKSAPSSSSSSGEETEEPHRRRRRMLASIRSYNRLSSLEREALLSEKRREAPLLRSMDEGTSREGMREWASNESDGTDDGESNGSLGRTREGLGAATEIFENRAKGDYRSHRAWEEENLADETERYSAGSKRELDRSSVENGHAMPIDDPLSVDPILRNPILDHHDELELVRQASPVNMDASVLRNSLQGEVRGAVSSLRSTGESDASRTAMGRSLESFELRRSLGISTPVAKLVAASRELINSIHVDQGDEGRRLGTAPSDSSGARKEEEEEEEQQTPNESSHRLQHDRLIDNEDRSPSFDVARRNPKGEQTTPQMKWHDKRRDRAENQASVLPKEAPSRTATAVWQSKVDHLELEDSDVEDQHVARLETLNGVVQAEHRSHDVDGRQSVAGDVERLEEDVRYGSKESTRSKNASFIIDQKDTALALEDDKHVVYAKKTLLAPLSAADGRKPKALESKGLSSDGGSLERPEGAAALERDEALLSSCPEFGASEIVGANIASSRPLSRSVDWKETADLTSGAKTRTKSTKRVSFSLPSSPRGHPPSLPRQRETVHHPHPHSSGRQTDADAGGIDGQSSWPLHEISQDDAGNKDGLGGDRAQRGYQRNEDRATAPDALMEDSTALDLDLAAQLMQNALNLRHGRRPSSSSDRKDQEEEMIDAMVSEYDRMIAKGPAEDLQGDEEQVTDANDDRTGTSALSDAAVHSAAAEILRKALAASLRSSLPNLGDGSSPVLPGLPLASSPLNLDLFMAAVIANAGNTPTGPLARGVRSGDTQIFDDAAAQALRQEALRRAQEELKSSGRLHERKALLEPIVPAPLGMGVRASETVAGGVSPATLREGLKSHLKAESTFVVLPLAHTSPDGSESHRNYEAVTECGEEERDGAVEALSSFEKFQDGGRSQLLSVEKHERQVPRKDIFEGSSNGAIDPIDHATDSMCEEREIAQARNSKDVRELQASLARDRLASWKDKHLKRENLTGNQGDFDDGSMYNRLDASYGPY